MFGSDTTVAHALGLVYRKGEHPLGVFGERKIGRGTHRFEAHTFPEQFVAEYAHVDPDRRGEIHQGPVSLTQHPEQDMLGRNLMTRRAACLIAGKKERPADVFVKSFEHDLQMVRPAGRDG